MLGLNHLREADLIQEAIQRLGAAKGLEPFDHVVGSGITDLDKEITYGVEIKPGTFFNTIGKEDSFIPDILKLLLLGKRVKFVQRQRLVHKSNLAKNRGFDVNLCTLSKKLLIFVH